MGQSPCVADSCSCSSAVKIPMFYGTWSFIIVFTCACQQFLFWATSVQSSAHPTTLFYQDPFNIILPLFVGLTSGLFPSGFLTKNLSAISHCSHGCYVPCPSHLPWSDHINFGYDCILWSSSHTVFSNLLLLIPLRSTLFCYPQTINWII
jgi:hypothetical protein